MGISTAAGTVDQICVFIGSDLDAYWFRSRCESFPNGLMLGSHGGDAGNSTSMSSGSGDGEAKSEMEESLLRWRLHCAEGFCLTG